MVAWVSTIEMDRVPRDSTASTWVRSHDAVTQVALVRTSGVVPALLADPYPDDESCLAALRRRVAELDALWARANGMVEMTLLLGLQTVLSSAPGAEQELNTGAEVRASASQAGAADIGPGRRYLDARRADDPVLAHADTLERVARALAAAVDVWIKDGNTRGSPHIGTLSLSHLISRESSPAYQSAVSGIVVPPALRLVVDGPRAPYSFAALPPRAAARF